MINLPKTWQVAVTPECFESVQNNLAEARKSDIIYPEDKIVFRALELVRPDRVKIVFLGQDPYIGKDEADGLAFSSNKLTLTLREIFRLLPSNSRSNPDLSDWAEQGLLLLNSVLTVTAGRSLSNRELGWELLTGQIIRYLSTRYPNVLFVGFGKIAQKVIMSNTEEYNFTLFFEHPAYRFNKLNNSLEQFKTSNLFFRCNQYLADIDKPIIKFD